MSIEDRYPPSYVNWNAIEVLLEERRTTFDKSQLTTQDNKPALPLSIWAHILRISETSTRNLRGTCKAFLVLSFQCRPADSKVFMEALRSQRIYQGLMQAWFLLHNPQFDAGSNRNQALINACWKKLYPFIDKLLENPTVNPSEDNNFPFQLALIREDHFIVKRLLQDTRIAQTVQARTKNFVLLIAARKGWEEIVDKLAKGTDFALKEFIGTGAAVLKEACKNGHDKIVNILLLKGAEPFESHLKIAAELGYLEIVKQLLSYRKNCSLQSALQAACENARRELVIELYAVIMKEWEEFSYVFLGYVEFKNEFLGWVCKSGNLEFVKEIIEKYFLQPNQEESRLLENCGLAIKSLAFDKEPIREAIRYSNWNIIVYVVHVDKIYRLDTDDFVLACCYGRLETVRNFLYPSEDVFHKKITFDTGFQAACEEGHVEIVRAILESKKVDLAKSGNLALQKASEEQEWERDAPLNKRDAARKKREEIIKMLIAQEGVDPSAENNKAIKNIAAAYHGEIMDILLNDMRVREKLTGEEDIQFRLWSAAWKGELQLVQELVLNPLIDQKAKLEALCFAVHYNQKEIVRELLPDFSAMVDSADPHEYDLLLNISSEKGFLEIVKELLKENYLQQYDSEGHARRTALYLAARNGHLEVLELLLFAGAGRLLNCLQVACKRGHIHIVTRLLKEAQRIKNEILAHWRECENFSYLYFLDRLKSAVPAKEHETIIPLLEEFFAT